MKEKSSKKVTSGCQPLLIDIDRVAMSLHLRYYVGVSTLAPRVLTNVTMKSR